MARLGVGSITIYDVLDGGPGSAAPEKYSWMVYSNSRTTGTISTTDTTMTYLGVAHNQSVSAPNTASHTPYVWYLAVETIDLSDANILINKLNAAQINVSDLFAQNIIATGTITGAKIQTSSDVTKDRIILDDDTFKHYAANDTFPTLTIGLNSSPNVSVVDVGHAGLGQSDYNGRTISAYCDYDSISLSPNTFVNYGTAVTLSLSNYHGTESSSAGRALNLYSYKNIPLKITSPSTVPPMEVNSSVQVDNLNAQYLNGKKSSELNAVPVYTLLYRSTAGNGNGDIFLSQDYKNFDFLVVTGGADNDDFLATYTTDVAKLEEDRVLTNSRHFVLFHGAGGDWWRVNPSANGLTLTRYSDSNALIHGVYGMNLEIQ